MPNLSAPALETAPALVAVWRDLAPRLMELCRIERQLLDRVTRAPKAAFHAYAAFIAASVEKPAESVAHAAYRLDPRDLLAEALGTRDRPVGPVWRLLKRLEARHALPLQTYARLAALADAPQIGLLLRASEAIGDRTLDACETLQREIATDDLLAAAAAGIMPATPRNVSRTREALLLLRAHGVADELMRARLAKCRTMHQLQRVLSAAFQRITLPALGVELSPRLRHLRDVRALLKAGRIFSNCLANLPPHVVDDFICGKFCLLEFSREGKPHALVTLELLSRFTNPVLARMKSVLGPKNKRIEPDMNEEIGAQLRAIPGLALMQNNLAVSLASIVEATPAPDNEIDDEFERMLGTVDETDLVPL